MTFASKVNLLFWELETFERKIQAENSTSPKFASELRRLKYEVNRLHWDAHHVDEAIRTARFRSYVYDQNAGEINKRIYILRNEIGFAKSQLASFSQLSHNPPVNSSIFSSPSNSISSSPEHPGAASSVFWFGAGSSPQRNSQKTSSSALSQHNNPQNLSQSSSHSGYSSQRSGQGSSCYSGGTYQGSSQQMCQGLGGLSQYRQAFNQQPLQLPQRTLCTPQSSFGRVFFQL